MSNSPELYEESDTEFAEIADWGKSKGLSDGALLVFVFKRGSENVQNTPWKQSRLNETVALFRKNKDQLLNPLLEVDKLLDTQEQWVVFTHILLENVALFSQRNYLDEQRKNIREAKKIKAKIRKKTTEIIQLAAKLEELGSYEQAGTATWDFYPDIFLRASRIHNTHFQNQRLPRLPGLKNACFYEKNVSDQFEALIDYVTGHHEDPDRPYNPHPFPTLESLILAYGQFIEEQAGGWVSDQLRFSRETSQADLVRSFFGELRILIDSEHLPEKLKSLSIDSFFIPFVTLFYPYSTSKPRQFINAATWTAKKDELKSVTSSKTA
jgi:hypothetical protein